MTYNDNESVIRWYQINRSCTDSNWSIGVKTPENQLVWGIYKNQHITWLRISHVSAVSSDLGRIFVILEINAKLLRKCKSSYKGGWLSIILTWESPTFPSWVPRKMLVPPFFLNVILIPAIIKVYMPSWVD